LNLIVTAASQQVNGGALPY